MGRVRPGDRSAQAPQSVVPVLVDTGHPSDPVGSSPSLFVEGVNDHAFDTAAVYAAPSDLAHWFRSRPDESDGLVVGTVLLVAPGCGRPRSVEIQDLSTHLAGPAPASGHGAGTGDALVTVGDDCCG